MKQSIVPTAHHRTLGSDRLVPTARIPGAMLGLLLCMSLGVMAGCSSKDKDAKSGDGSQTNAKTDGDTGGKSGGRSSFTQRILDLDAAQLKELGVKAFPKGAKPLYPPGSTADFIQSVRLISSQTVCFDSKLMAHPQANLGAYYIVCERPPIPLTIWKDVYGPFVEVNSQSVSTGFKADTRVFDFWKIACSDETLLIRGACTEKTLKGEGYKQGLVILNLAYFSKRHSDYCPKAGDARRDVGFSYK